MVIRTSVGVEVAGREVRIAVIHEFAGKRRLLRLETLPQFLDGTTEQRVRTLSLYFNQNRIPHSHIQLVLPAACGVIRDVEFPGAAAGHLRSAVALQLDNLSPWGTDEIYWDFAYEPPKKGSTTVWAHVAIAPKAVLDPWISLFRAAGLALAGASLSSLSRAHGASLLWTAEPVMIVGLEDSYVEGMLVRDGRLYAVGLEGSPARALVESAASQLQRAGRVGDGEQIRTVVCGSSAEGVVAEPVPLPIEKTAANAVFGFGAISGALLGTSASGFRSNLIPRSLRFRRNHLRLVPTYVLAVLVVALAVAFWMREPYQQLVYASQLDKEIRRLAPEGSSLAKQDAQLNELSTRLKTLNNLTLGRDANLEALRELVRILPADVWLTSYQQEDDAFTISGFSAGAARLQKVIEDSPVFRDAQFVSSITRDASGKDRFTIRARTEVRQ
jgi:general secretion pathway protein L